MTDSSTLRSPNPLLAALGRVLQSVLNRAIALDPDSAERLRALEGRRIALHLQAPPLAIGIEVIDGALKVGPARDLEAPDLSLAASLGALLSQALPAGGRSATPGGRMTISGDAELAQRLQKLARDYAPDFEAAFSGLFGEVLGVQIARALGGALKAGGDSARKFARDGVDYLVEERRELVSSVEQAIFFDEVDALRDDVERLAARVGRLSR
ncbi:MAG: SCP2 sterol-binding domain-containing protein [Lysobacteraceae bacterium]